MSNKNCIENLPEVGDILTGHTEALEEMKKRQNNTELITEVTAFLSDDIPNHFVRTKPFFYLSRHLATPNLETLHASDVASELGVELIVGEDIQDKFVSNNDVKKSLAKLSFEVGASSDKTPIIQNVTIVDFNKSNGKPLYEVDTFTGKKLHLLHKELLEPYTSSGIIAFDESDWVARNKNDNMQVFYEKFLSLMIVHGIMLEFYAVEDAEFVEEVLRPSFKKVESRFGHKPLISALLKPHEEFERNWLAYPLEVKEQLEIIMSQN